ncbi:SRPBCC family protein [uncultured Pseudoalteromonas sp.]|uniref:SRPBCC family protein n=1 Tax=uncultured Pseudoalteromonas sp. TaxID=114053 RepID=UPI0030C83298
MIFISIKQTLNAEPLQIITTLLDHQQLDRFFNAKFELIQTQNSGELKGGKGAIRQVKMANATFNERIVMANPGHICYQIIGDKPVAHHQGDIYLVANAGAKSSTTELTYCIRCKAPWWLPNALLKHLISKDIIQALIKLQHYFMASKV